MPSKTRALLEIPPIEVSPQPPVAAASAETSQSFVPILRPVMPELDAVRGVAVLLVLFYHGLFWSSNGLTGHSAPVRALLEVTRPGWLGVELFFVLSGFLITNILVGSRIRRDYYTRFYSRRAFRILPAYVVLLAALLVTRTVGWRFAAASALFLANVSTYLGIPMQYGPLWSLAVEEHFYLVWPAAVRRFSQRRLLFLAVLIVLLEPVVRYTAFRAVPTIDVYGPTWFMLDGLAMGAVLALVIRLSGESRVVLRRLTTTLAVAAPLLFFVGVPFGIATRRVAFGAAMQGTPWYLLFTASIGAILLLGSGPNRRLVRRPVLAFFGAISYGLYLVHLLVFSLYDRYVSFPGGARSDAALLSRFAVCAALSILIAVVSRWTLEEYFLRVKDRTARNRHGEREAIANLGGPA